MLSVDPYITPNLFSRPIMNTTIALDITPIYIVRAEFCLNSNIIIVDMYMLS
jgi:hypothetical protein